MNGLKITGINSKIVGMLDETLNAAEIILDHLEEIKKTIKFLKRLEKAGIKRIPFNQMGTVPCDGEFLGEFIEAMVGLYLRKGQKLASFEWEIPFPKPEEDPADGSPDS